MDKLTGRLILNLETITDSKLDWTRIKKMIVIETNHHKYFKKLVKENKTFTYVGSLADIEFPMALGFRNIKMVDQQYSEENSIDELIIPKINMYGSIVKDEKISSSERMIKVLLENGELCCFHFVSLIIDYGTPYLKMMKEKFSNCKIGEISWDSGVLCSFRFSYSDWISEASKTLSTGGYILITESPSELLNGLPPIIRSSHEFIEHSQLYWKGLGFQQKILTTNLINTGGLFLCEKV
jgi:hypothetical protein